MTMMVVVPLSVMGGSRHDSYERANASNAL
jgi:hypothetical protein